MDGKNTLGLPQTIRDGEKTTRKIRKSSESSRKKSHIHK